MYCLNSYTALHSCVIIELQKKFDVVSRKLQFVKETSIRSHPYDNWALVTNVPKALHSGCFFENVARHALSDVLR